MVGFLIIMTNAFIFLITSIVLGFLVQPHILWQLYLIDWFLIGPELSNCTWCITSSSPYGNSGFIFALCCHFSLIQVFGFFWMVRLSKSIIWVLVCFKAPFFLLLYIKDFPEMLSAIFLSMLMMLLSTLKCDGDSRQQLELTSEPECGLCNTLYWIGKRLVNSLAEKTQLALVDHSNKCGERSDL